MMKKFLSELYGKELKDEDLPEELRPAKANDKDNEDDKQQIIFKTGQPSFFMPFNHYGVEWCQWTAEPKACRTCAEYAGHNGGVYRVKDVPTLPAHPNCRCALSAYWKDEKSNVEVARLKRKKNTEKRVTINKEKQRKLTAEFRKNGVKVWQDAEAEAYLKKKGANAIALSEYLIVLKNKPIISEVLEEL